VFFVCLVVFGVGPAPGGPPTAREED
jgi:hypothetical protein